MDIVIQNGSTLLGQIGQRVKRADDIGDVTMRVVLTEDEYQQIRLELGIGAAKFHPQVLPLFGDRTVYYVIKGADGKEYNPYIEDMGRQFLAAQAQGGVPQDILEELHDVELPGGEQDEFQPETEH